MTEHIVEVTQRIRVVIEHDEYLGGDMSAEHHARNLAQRFAIGALGDGSEEQLIPGYGWAKEWGIRFERVEITAKVPA